MEPRPKGSMGRQEGAWGGRGETRRDCLGGPPGLVAQPISRALLPVGSRARGTRKGAARSICTALGGVGRPWLQLPPVPEAEPPSLVAAPSLCVGG